jgi:hypothetical protein
MRSRGMERVAPLTRSIGESGPFDGIFEIVRWSPSLTPAPHLEASSPRIAVKMITASQTAPWVAVDWCLEAEFRVDTV